MFRTETEVVKAELISRSSLYDYCDGLTSELVLNVVFLDCLFKTYSISNRVKCTNNQKQNYSFLPSVTPLKSKSKSKLKSKLKSKIKLKKTQKLR